MSSSTYRSQLKRKREQRVDAEKRAASARSKETEKRAAAARARSAAASSRSESTIKSKLREAERYENEANSAGKDSASWQTKASSYLKEEARLTQQLGDAELAERKLAERARQGAERQREQAARAEARRRDEQERQRDRDAAEVARRHQELAAQVTTHEDAIAHLREPRKENLRLLILTASGRGDLRVGREQKRIQDAVRFASGRDSVTIDVRPAATGDDLLSGLTQSRPHIVHFSGHADESVVVFEQDVDGPNPGAVVTGAALAASLAAVDEPPLLVVLNACSSAGQAERIAAGGIASFSIGHSDSISDADAIAYSARLYAALADGQSIGGAHDLAKAALQISGTPDFDLPTLYASTGADPRDAVVVLPLN